MMKSLIIGSAVGDALGVPFEFIKREQIKKNPVSNMVGFGTHNQPKGTFSDDTSLSLCLLDSLKTGYDLRNIGDKFVEWKYNNLWTANGDVFDIGNTTSRAISNLKQNKLEPIDCGGKQITDNGNGSLMRILPILDYIKEKHIKERYKVIFDISSLTHAHFISKFACFILVEYALKLIKLKSEDDSNLSLIPIHALAQTRSKIRTFVYENNIKDNLDIFDNVLGFKYKNKGINRLSEKDIFSGGYVIDTLEASLWCLTTTDNYKDAVLKAVNLGEDTDTTGTVTGGLAGLLYGFDSIPSDWVSKLKRKDDIIKLVS